MSETLEKTENTLILIENIDVNKLPELQGMKEKQLEIVRENPFVEIIDNKTYEDAKKARTTLVSARTEIQNQDKEIAKKIKKFRESVAGASEELISITRPHEEKQQSEVKRWEEIKEREKQEKARIEEERKNKIRNSIKTIIDEALSKVSRLSFETVESLRVDFEQNLYKTDVSQFAEFELDFNEKLMQVKNAFSSKEKVLQDAEAQRLEKIKLQEESDRLAAERAKFEAEQKAESERLAKIQAEQAASIEAERKAMAAEKAKQEAEMKAKEIEAENARKAESAKLAQERAELEAEKTKAAQIEAERIAKEQAEIKAKEDAERIAAEKSEEDAKAEAEALRLEALKPEKDKAIEYLQSFKYSKEWPVFTDAEFENVFNEKISSIDQLIHEQLVPFFQNYK
jgi:hypothetical protein